MSLTNNIGLVNVHVLLPTMVDNFDGISTFLLVGLACGYLYTHYVTIYPKTYVSSSRRSISNDRFTIMFHSVRISVRICTYGSDKGSIPFTLCPYVISHRFPQFLSICVRNYQYIKRQLLGETPGIFKFQHFLKTLQQFLYAVRNYLQRRSIFTTMRKPCTLQVPTLSIILSTAEAVLTSIACDAVSQLLLPCFIIRSQIRQ